MRQMFGFGSVFALPCAIFAGIAAVFCCYRRGRCSLRDCTCVKRCLRCFGHDEFDDFELVVLVHEAIFEKKTDARKTTIVRITAGAHVVKTDPTSNGYFQQPLHVQVNQGTQRIVVDLLDSSERVLATLPLDTVHNVLASKTLQPEMVYTMKLKGKGIRNPKVKLTMVVQTEKDMESGLMSGISGAGMNSDVDILVRQQLRKARDARRTTNEGEQEGVSEMEVLKNACAGPLEVFERLGNTRDVHVAVLGPPSSRRWVLGIWHDKRDFEAKRSPSQEIDLLKVQSVQADPSRHHVFMITYHDSSHVRQALTFRRIDRARDVWVEILHIMVTKAHEQRQALKLRKSTSPGHERKTKSFGSKH